MLDLSPFGLIWGVAATFIMFGCGLFLRTFQFRRKAQLVDALLVDVEDHDDVREDGLISYRLYYEYSAMDGRVILVQVSSLLRQIPTVGTKLRMLVDPQKPKILRRTGVQEYMAPVLIAQVGFVMLLLEIILY